MGLCYCTGACRNGQGCPVANQPPHLPTTSWPKQNTGGTGWTCPSCGASVSPAHSTCPNCQGHSQTSVKPEGCGHTFAFHMVIPPGGAYITCPICGAQNFVHGTTITC